MNARIELRGVDIASPSGRPLFAGLTLVLGGARVALVGRNGVGKSTLLATLARAPEVGGSLRGRVCFVPQLLPRAEPGLSHGEQRRRALARARASGADIMLLDEPSEDLDEGGVAWLRD